MTKTTTKTTKSNITVAVAKASVVLGVERSLLPKETCKRKAFTEEEDVFMTRAYVNTTQDSIKGSGQKGKAFWNEVLQKFDILRPASNTAWGPDSIQRRFKKTIAKECTEFLAFLHAAKTVEQSGWSVEQYIEAANILFIAQHSKPFKHTKCMAVLVELPKYSIDPLTPYDNVDQESGDENVVVMSNPIMSVQGAGKKRPMGRKKAKRKAKDDSLSANTTSKIDTGRMLAALERKNDLKMISHRQRSWQMQALFWMKMGDKKKATEYMTLLEQDQQKCNSIPSTVDLLSSSTAGDDTVVSGGDINMKDNSYDLDEGNGEEDNISSTISGGNGDGESSVASSILLIHVADDDEPEVDVTRVNDVVVQAV